jgi:hypothetical protein
MSTRLLTRAERDELRRRIESAFFRVVCGKPTMRIPAERDDVDVVLADYTKILDALDAAEADSAELRDTLRRHGFQPCDITACNCSGWHQTGGFYARFNEIDEAVGEHDGETLLAAVQRMVKERAAALAQRDRAEAELATMERMAWEALGKPDGTHDTSNVQRLCEAFAATKAKLSEVQERVDLDIDEFRRILSELDGLRVSIPLTPESGKVLYDLVDALVLRATTAGRQRVPLIEQRDRAEKERDDAKAKLADALEKRDGAFALISMADNERKIAEGMLAALSEIHPFHHWGDHDGAVLWFCLPVSEPPFHVGTPGDSDWPWGENDMADAEFTSQIGWSRLPRVNENIASRGPTDSLPSPEAPSPSDGMRGSREHRSGRDSRPACGHSACSQHHIDTGSAECVEGDDGN